MTDEQLRAAMTALWRDAVGEKGVPQAADAFMDIVVALMLRSGFRHGLVDKAMGRALKRAGETGPVFEPMLDERE